MKRSKTRAQIRNTRGRSALSATSKRAMTQAGSARSSDQEVMVHLSRSQIFKDYERAFSEAMGLPLNIRAHHSWSPAHHGKTDRDSFAAILARFNQARAACLRAQTRPSRDAGRARRGGSVAEVGCKSGFRQTWQLPP